MASLKETNPEEYKRRRRESSRNYKKRNALTYKPLAVIRAKAYFSRPESKRKARNSLLLRKYNITIEEQERMLLEQEGKCAVCNIALSTTKQINIDHCHKTGKIRGILCSNCNLATGLLKDDPGIVISLLNYLKQ